MELIDYVLIGLAGLTGGFIAGFLGIGGGIVYVLILPIAFSNLNFSEESIVQLTIANSIFGVFFASLSASITYWLGKEFYWKEITLVSIAGGIGAVLAFELIVDTIWYSKDLFNSILVLLLSYLLYNTIKNRNLEKESKVPPRKKNNGFFLFAGFGGGLVSALSGLGGGTVLIPFLNSVMRIRIHRAKAISLGMILFTSLVITFLNLTSVTANVQFSNSGYIVFPVALPLSLGVVIASPLGVRISKTVSSSNINIIFAIFIFLVIISKVWETYLYFTGQN